MGDSRGRHRCDPRSLSGQRRKRKPGGGDDDVAVVRVVVAGVGVAAVERDTQQQRHVAGGGGAGRRRPPRAADGKTGGPSFDFAHFFSQKKTGVGPAISSTRSSMNDGRRRGTASPMTTSLVSQFSTLTWPHLHTGSRWP